MQTHGRICMHSWHADTWSYLHAFMACRHGQTLRCARTCEVNALGDLRYAPKKMRGRETPNHSSMSTTSVPKGTAVEDCVNTQSACVFQSLWASIWPQHCAPCSNSNLQLPWTMQNHRHIRILGTDRHTEFDTRSFRPVWTRQCR
jgi:hypothetical protein